ncbi:glutathione S-transferase [uncultured Sphingomonas sp.]|uniref:glutathione S-transferase n=1 Tax=uncultured Sphingomonas sp. TaxID=158754 RepID=UPI0025EEF542|nr:glutathione S-transferase [uncultured Sphingomonas sp.]
MLRLIIGNKAYSSWSLRGWLAVKQSGLPFAEEVVAMYADDWAERRAKPDLAVSNGKVPIVWDGDVAVWESLAIIDHLADRVGRNLFWPADDTARAFARSIAAEMHAGFVDLRRECPTNFRRRYDPTPVSDAATTDVARIASLWRQALDRFAGEGGFLFGEFGAADIMFAPVVSRFDTYALPLPDFAQVYCARMLAHPWMQQWYAEAAVEPWVLDRYERDQ